MSSKSTENSKAEDPKTPASFNTTETKLILAYFKHSNPASNVDWDAVAKEAGYNKVESCRRYFNVMKEKHGLGKGSKSGGDANSTTATKKRAGKSVEDSPAKKGKADL